MLPKQELTQSDVSTNDVCISAKSATRDDNGLDVVGGGGEL